MNLDYLHTFVEVVRSGSFSEAARRLSITQPAVSFQVQRLERDLGVRLLDRRQKGVGMTEAGERLLAFAQDVVSQRESLVRDLEHLRETVAGNLAIAASTIPGEFLLPVMLSEFKALHPVVSIRVDVSDSLTVIAGVRDAVFEVGFCGIAPEGTDLDACPVGEDEIVLAVFSEHPFAEREAVSLNEVASESLVFREETSATQRHLDELLARSGLDAARISPRLVLGSSQAVVSAVEAGAGIAFVSSLAIRKSLDLNLVRQVKVAGVGLRRRFFCIYREERLVSRLLAEFVAFVKARAPQP